MPYYVVYTHFTKVTYHSNKTYTQTYVYMLSVVMETQTKQIIMLFYNIFCYFGDFNKKKSTLDDFNFDIVNFPFLDGDVPQRPSYGEYIYLNLFALPEHLHMLLTSIIVTNS